MRAVAASGGRPGSPTSEGRPGSAASGRRLGGAASSGRPGGATWSALGTRIVLRVTDARSLPVARERVARELDAIDRACSRFRADSELARVNAAAGRRMRVSALLAEALALALRAAELTGGDVDPTVGRALELAGYDRDWLLVERAAQRRQAGAGAERGSAALTDGVRPAPRLTLRSRPGWQAVALDASGGSVRVPRGVRLDLGAIAKAWAADRAARAAASTAGCGALVGVGGDIAACGQEPPQGWRVHVTDDHRSDASAPGQTIAIFGGGLATSSVAVRCWRRDGRTMHHIIDPRTGAPARTAWRTVSVAAASCAEANIATTAALVRGERALEWLAGLGLPARLVDHAGDARHLGAWPAAQRERDG